MHDHFFTFLVYLQFNNDILSNDNTTITIECITSTLLLASSEVVGAMVPKP